MKILDQLLKSHVLTKVFVTGLILSVPHISSANGPVQWGANGDIPLAFDSNGDNRQNWTVYRPSEQRWWIVGGNHEQYGIPGDIPIPADYNGDGRDDIAMWRPSKGHWWIRGQFDVQWGWSEDTPVPADFNGDGKDDIAVWRPSTGEWWVKEQFTTQWGQRSDIPVPGDFNGDGRDDLVVWRPSDGNWWVKDQVNVQWGQSGDIPLQFDVEGDGRADFVVWRPSNGTFYMKGKGHVQYGQQGDIPVAADINGDGRTDFVLWRPSNGYWYYQINTAQSSQSSAPRTSGSVDPAAEMKKVRPEIQNFLNPFVGMMTITNASGPQLEQNQVFAVEGRLDTRAISGSHLLPQIVRTAVQSGRPLFGLPHTVDAKVALSFANNEWDLSIAIKVADTFKITSNLVPVVDPGFAFKSAHIVLHAKQPIGGAPTVSAELLGDVFVKPTARDPWLALRPSVEINNQAELTIGGTLTGVCGWDIGGNTSPQSCGGIWNVLDLQGMLTARSGLLRLTLDPKAPPPHITGIETALQEATFNNTIQVDGALITDLDASPGFGVSLTERRSANSSDARDLLAMMPFANQSPFAVALGSMPAGMTSSAERTIIIAPTAMNVGHINYPRPTFAFRGAAQGGGLSAVIDGRLSADVDIMQLINNHQNIPNVDIALDISYDPGNINNDVRAALNQIPGMSLFANHLASQFSLDRFYVTAQRTAFNKYVAKAYADVRVMGRQFTVDYPISINISGLPSAFGGSQNATPLQISRSQVSQTLAHLVTGRFDLFGELLLRAIMNINPQTAARLAQEVGNQLRNGNHRVFAVALTDATNVVRGLGMPIPQEIDNTVNATSEFVGSVKDKANDAGEAIVDTARDVGNSLNPTNWW